MARQHLITRAELERQMDAARQLRAETLAGVGWIFSALAGAVGVLHRTMLRIITRAQHQA